MRKHDDESKKVCASCVTEDYLQQLIESKANGGCSYCEEADVACVALEELADLVEEAFEAHFERTPSEPSDFESALMRDKEMGYDWYRDGEPVLDVITGITCCEPEVGEDLLAVLNERHASYDPGDPCEGENEFDPESCYERTNAKSVHWHVQWRRLEMALKYESRLCNQEVLKLFDSVFAGLDQARTHHGTVPIVDAGPGTELLGVYRAREFQSQNDLKKALQDPVKELGPPDGSIARANRMNASGISVFYGAKDASSALAEVRPAVGSKVVVANFLFTRPLKLLDLRSLETVTCSGSLFDPAYTREVERVGFLRTLTKLLILPVMPNEQEREYLMTQAIADYLASLKQPSLDGIIFPSVQDGVGENVVLFHKASLVEKLQYPQGTRVTAGLMDFDPETEDSYPSYSIHISQPEEPSKQKRGQPITPFEPNWLLKTERKNTLQLVIDSIVVHTVKAVCVETSPDRVFVSHGTHRERSELDSPPGDF
ncbi:RES domain-containing protein [Pseudomonas sp. NMI542_15]|uniref:RES domain-containing protein n=1 Tax=Pseudomonas sp. NMI542_15 TaxID=2903148 RepID=UPI001E2E228D|nr:RES domain-containing protein [Pseudomonas sp. NMI542_15]MCE0778539.1 RES family NAD+ phosphorylase [Pseudomonas sp. NMI542_15]